MIKEIRLNDEYFGEGVALYGDKIYQLTWTSHTGFIYDKESLEDAGSFRYATEGWGLTHWDTYLVMSDGSERLHFYDTKRWKLKKSISVYDDKEPIGKLNELENIEGLIYANVYEKDFIVIIHPSTGEVVGRIDLSDLFDSHAYAKETGHQAGVMNGIAATPEGHLLITGKLWPYLYELEITPQPYPLNSPPCFLLHPSLFPLSVPSRTLFTLSLPSFHPHKTPSPPPFSSVAYPQPLHDNTNA